jgi:hypothetical protein
MSESRKIVFGFAVLGLAVAGICYAFSSLHDYSRPMTGFESTLILLSIVVCPPQLILAFCMGCEVIGWSGLFQYAVVGFFNTALYAGVGALVASFLKKSE